MSARHTLNYILSDDQMRAHLESGDSLVFEELGRDWQRLERQVERLGFANEYFVSLTKGPRGELTKVAPARKS
jgi:hypothetical protein